MTASAIRRGRRPSIVDAWIAAIALTNGHPVVITRDRVYAGLDGIEVRKY
jgi:predicted nucleic acid-binding protein